MAQHLAEALYIDSFFNAISGKSMPQNVEIIVRQFGLFEYFFKMIL
jgi:hypothetical protein